MSLDRIAGADGTRFVVAGTKAWNARVFEERLATQPGQWLYVGRREELTSEWLGTVAPAFVFFLHWSWIVPDEILTGYRCVGFHLGDLPYGRGGSPLQNLIARGHRETCLTAFRLTDVLDGGPVYGKRRISLEGGAEEIYIRATELSAEMILDIVSDPPEPVPQQGEPVVFARRSPGESRIPALPGLGALHDFIRMLDADGYPPAFLEHAGFRYEFRRSTMYEGRIEASVRISRAMADGS